MAGSEIYLPILGKVTQLAKLGHLNVKTPFSLNKTQHNLCHYHIIKLCSRECKAASALLYAESISA